MDILYENILLYIGLITFVIAFIIALWFFDFDMVSTVSSVVHVGQAEPVEVHYEKTQIPFICSLASHNHINNEVEFVLRLDVPCCIQVFWGPLVKEILHLLYSPWDEFYNKLKNNDLDTLKSEDKRFYNPEECNYEPLILKLKRDETLPSLGKPIRSRFPLLIFATRQQTPDDQRLNVGSLVTLVHIQDKDCPMTTSIFDQYLKHFSGQVNKLQNLFTQSSDPSPSASAEATRPRDNFARIGEDDEGSLCVICRVDRPTHALLPCRHVCVCCNCMRDLHSRRSLCPLCRTRIDAFFVTDRMNMGESYG